MSARVISLCHVLCKRGRCINLLEIVFIQGRVLLIFSRAHYSRFFSDGRRRNAGKFLRVCKVRSRPNEHATTPGNVNDNRREDCPVLSATQRMEFKVTSWDIKVMTVDFLQPPRQELLIILSLFWRTRFKVTSKLHSRCRFAGTTGPWNRIVWNRRAQWNANNRSKFMTQIAIVLTKPSEEVTSNVTKFNTQTRRAWRIFYSILLKVAFSSSICSCSQKSGGLRRAPSAICIIPIFTPLLVSIFNLESMLFWISPFQGWVYSYPGRDFLPCMNLFLQITWALFTQTSLASFCQNGPNYLPLQAVFLLYRSSV